MATTLEQLFAEISADQVLSSNGDLSTRISAEVVESSQEAQPGGVFVARVGQSTDGHRFIPQAIEAGAAAIVGEAELSGLPVPYVRVKSAQAALGHLAAAYHDFPARKLVVIGITGTDGKTTTCHMLRSIFDCVADIKAGYISTLSADFGA